MVWIESHDDLLDHPKTIRAARLLGIPAVHLTGHLHALWWWSMSYADDGDLMRFDALDVAAAAHYEGDADAFVEALVRCGPGESSGFLDRAVDGTLSIHDWDDYGGKLTARRRANRDRMRKARAEHVQDTDSAPTNKEETTFVARASHVQNTCADSEDTCETRAEREDRTVPTNSSVANATGQIGQPSKSKPRTKAKSKPSYQTTSEPFLLFAAFCEELDADISLVDGKEKGKQCAVAEEFLSRGHTEDDLRGLVRYLKSETWRTSPIDMTTCLDRVGPWKLNGSPATAERPKNGTTMSKREEAMWNGGF